MAPVPAGQPGVRVPGDRAGARPPGARALAVAGAVAAALTAYAQAADAGVAGPSAVPAVVRTAVAALALFGIAGYGVARLALPEPMLVHLWLVTPAVGAATATLALTVLGLLHVPLAVSLAIVLVAGLALGVAAVRRREVPPPGDLVVNLVVPAFLAALIAAIVLLPTFRAGYATVSGQNGDAVLAVGTADLLQHAPPTAVRPELALDRVPIQWRSKLPIYYGLGGIAKLSGRDPIAAFPTVTALVLALAAIGVFLFVVHAMGAPVGVGLLALFLVGLDRILIHVGIHPYFNQAWAQFALPFVLLFGWKAIAAPARGTALLAAAFLALALFAYPLLLPFPALFLGVVAWQHRSELRRPSVRLPRWLWPVVVVVAIPVVLVLVRGVIEKVGPALSALRPGGDMSGWAGHGVLPYLPFERFLGVDAVPVLVVGVLVAAWFGLRASRRDVGVALLVLLAAALLAGAYVRARGDGELFWFKDLSFAGPLILTAAIVGLAVRAPRVVAVAGLAALALVLANGTKREVAQTYEQVTKGLLDLRAWDREIPASESIRLDVAPNGWQLWSWYLMPRHAVSTPRPLRGFFPHPPVGRHADLALVKLPARRPADAVGAPLKRNGEFALYRLRPGGGVDTSSQALIFDVTRITY